MRSLSSNESQFISGGDQPSYQPVTVTYQYKPLEAIFHDIANLLHDISLNILFQNCLKKNKDIYSRSDEA